MNLTLPPGASAFRKTLVAFIEQHWSESELADSRPVSPNRKLFLQKKLDEWYNKIFDEDWGSAGLNEYLLGGNLGLCNGMFGLASAVHVIYLHL